MKRSFIFRV